MRRLIFIILLSAWIFMPTAGCIKGVFCPPAPSKNSSELSGPADDRLVIRTFPEMRVLLDIPFNNGHVRPPDTTKHDNPGTYKDFQINAHELPPTTSNESLDMSLAINSFQINTRKFALSFIHSVTMTPVRDNYEMTPDGGICQTSEIFESHCAGLPYSDQETGATRWEQKDGKFILHMKRDIPKLVVRTDKRYRNRLHIQDQVIDLNQWEDQALLIAVER